MRLPALIVEDDPAARNLLAQLLDSLDFSADLAADGEEALTLIGQRDYDVILLDIALPKVSGIEVMEWMLRNRPRLLSKIIVVTGLDVQRDSIAFSGSARDALQACAAGAFARSGALLRLTANDGRHAR